MGGVYRSLNLSLYAYGHLNPVIFLDPDGNEVSFWAFVKEVWNDPTAYGRLADDSRNGAELMAAQAQAAAANGEISSDQANAYAAFAGNSAYAVESVPLKTNGEVVGTGLALAGVKGVPRFGSSPVLGFSSFSSFKAFGGMLRSGLNKAGFADAKAFFQGSSVTGKSFRTGKAFDAGRVSDFDIALAGRSIFEKAKDLGIGLRGGGSRTGPLTSAQIEKLGLGGMRSELQGAAGGRPVNFMIYRDPAQAAVRSPSVAVE